MVPGCHLVDTYGLTVHETDRRACLLESAFTLLSDNERVCPEWRRLVLKHGVTGVQVHDARRVAALAPSACWP